jgi:hypothetical protein
MRKHPQRTVGGVVGTFFICLLRVSAGKKMEEYSCSTAVRYRIKSRTLSSHTRLFLFFSRCTTARSSRGRQNIIVPLVLASFRPLSKTTCTQSANSAVRPLDETRPSNQPTSKKMNMIIRPYPTHNVVPESWILRRCSVCRWCG